MSTKTHDTFRFEYRECVECDRDANSSVKYDGLFFCPWCEIWFDEDGEIQYKRGSGK